MMEVRISEEALDDLNLGFFFYEAQEPGLGEYFASGIRTDIETLKVSAGVHRVVHGDYHRLLSKLFPFGIFYTVEGGVPIIWAVLDLRRDPSWIKKRLER